MAAFTEDNFTEKVLERIQAKEPRTQKVIGQLVKHLHAFIRDVELTEAEWGTAIDFLTRTGQKCDDKRQEFILLSDVLGISMLVDAINHRSNQEVTETTVKGPFHAASNTYQMGTNIARGEELERGEPTIVRGKITDAAGNPIEGAIIDVWQSDDIGFYDLQDANQPDMNLRGTFQTGADGTYWFKTIKPAAYPVPTDGPVGELLEVSGRHPMRPAHIHFWVKGAGFQDLITHIFVEGDPYLESDAVFGVKDSLVLAFPDNESVEDAQKYDIASPFKDVEYNIKLAKA